MPTTPLPTTPPPTTPLDLLGRWHLEREIDDRYAGTRLRVTGTALLDRDEDDCVRWHEEGLLERPGAAPATVHRTLLVVRDAHGSWQVVFDDGRPFHPWRPGVEVEHPCVADLYRGVIEVGDGRGAVFWRVVWHVRGPAKDHTIRTTYTRASADGSLA